MGIQIPTWTTPLDISCWKIPPPPGKFPRTNVQTFRDISLRELPSDISPSIPPGAMRFRTRGHQFELPAIKYEFNKRNFIVWSLFNYVWFVCIDLYYLHFCISLYTCANVICIKLLLTYLPQDISLSPKCQLSITAHGLRVCFTNDDMDVTVLFYQMQLLHLPVLSVTLVCTLKYKHHHMTTFIIFIIYYIYTVSQKKTSPTFWAITRESIDGFL